MKPPFVHSTVGPLVAALAREFSEYIVPFIVVSSLEAFLASPIFNPSNKSSFVYLQRSHRQLTVTVSPAISHLAFIDNTICLYESTSTFFNTIVPLPFVIVAIFVFNLTVTVPAPLLEGPFVKIFYVSSNVLLGIS